MRHRSPPGDKTNRLRATLLPLATMLLMGLLAGLLACGTAAPPQEPGEFPTIPTAQPPALAKTAPADLPVAQPPAAAIESPDSIDAAAPAPQEGDSGEGDNGSEGETEEEEEDPTPTPTPNIVGCIIMPEPYQSEEGLGEMQVMKDGLKYQCFPTPDPTPTPKYPDLGDALSRYTVEGEEATEGKQAAADARITLGATFTDKASTDGVAWLAENGVPDFWILRTEMLGTLQGATTTYGFNASGIAVTEGEVFIQAHDLGCPEPALIPSVLPLVTEPAPSI